VKEPNLNKLDLVFLALPSLLLSSGDSGDLGLLFPVGESNSAGLGKLGEEADNRRGGIVGGEVAGDSVNSGGEVGGDVGVSALIFVGSNDKSNIKLLEYTTICNEVSI
jgi:hypothetical protein